MIGRWKLLQLYQKLAEYRKMISDIELELSKTKEAFEKENTESLQYLKDTEELINNIRTEFRNLTKQFYSNKPSGIEIRSNSDKNQNRFNVEAKIVGGFL